MELDLEVGWTSPTQRRVGLHNAIVAIVELMIWQGSDQACKDLIDSKIGRSDRLVSGELEIVARRLLRACGSGMSSGVE
jgi:hypothetical protein